MQTKIDKTNLNLKPSGYFISSQLKKITNSLIAA